MKDSRGCKGESCSASFHKIVWPCAVVCSRVSLLAFENQTFRTSSTVFFVLSAFFLLFFRRVPVDWQSRNCVLTGQPEKQSYKGTPGQVQSRHCHNAQTTSQYQANVGSRVTKAPLAKLKADTAMMRKQLPNKFEQTARATGSKNNLGNTKTV